MMSGAWKNVSVFFFSVIVISAIIPVLNSGNKTMRFSELGADSRGVI